MLKGRVCTLRPLEETDLPLLVEWRNSPRARASFFDGSLLSYSEQRRWYQRYCEDSRDKLWIIMSTDGSHPIGLIGLGQLDQHNQSAEVGRLLVGDDKDLRHGYGRDALATLTAFSFSELNLNRLYAYVLASNAPSLATFERCGFAREGTLRQSVWKGGRYRDVVLLSILRGEHRSDAEEQTSSVSRSMRDG